MSSSFPEEVQRRIDAYLRDVDAQLQAAGQSGAHRRAVIDDLERRLSIRLRPMPFWKTWNRCWHERTSFEWLQFSNRSSRRMKHSLTPRHFFAAAQ